MVDAPLSPIHEPGRKLAAASVLGLLASAGLLACSSPPGPADPAADAGSPDADATTEPDVAGLECAYDIDCPLEGELCLDGQCRVAVCHPGALSCRANELVRCDEGADSFTFVEVCPPGTACQRDKCVDRICEPEATLCDQTVRKVCNANGTGYEARPCLGERVCFEGSCVDPICSPGKTLCLDDLTVGECDELGGGYNGRLCGFGRRCQGAGCVPFHAITLGTEADDASASAPLRRPDAGYVALWLVRDEEADGPVELLAWTSPLDVGVVATWDGATGELVVGGDQDSETSRRYPAALPPGDVVHLVIAWGDGAIVPMIDGYALGEPLELTLASGTPSDTLTLGQFTADGLSWPGRLGSVHVGDGPIEEGFVPRCDAAPTPSPTFAWLLDDGQGTTAAPNTESTPPLTLHNAAWTGGILGRYARDADDDGFGYDIEAQIACGPINDDDRLRLGDCNDGNPIVYPDAPEPSDRIDNDCDGEVDE